MVEEEDAGVAEVEVLSAMEVGTIAHLPTRGAKRNHEDPDDSSVTQWPSSE